MNLYWNNTREGLYDPALLSGADFKTGVAQVLNLYRSKIARSQTQALEILKKLILETKIFTSYDKYEIAKNNATELLPLAKEIAG